MKKAFLILAVLFVIAAIGIIGFVLFSKNPIIVIGNHTFKLYIAKTAKDQQIGLSKYDKIPQDFGMIFIFEKPGYQSFWMKDMKFPIDIIFIKDNRIVTIYQDISPPKSQNENLLIYQPKSEANKVLEINAGLSQKYNFKEGDSINLKNI